MNIYPVNEYLFNEILQALSDTWFCPYCDEPIGIISSLYEKLIEFKLSYDKGEK